MADPSSKFRLHVASGADPARWQSLIEADPHAHALHEPAVQQAVATGIAGARPLWLEVEDDQGGLVAGLPLIVQSRWGLQKVVSGASGLYGGPVVRRGCEPAAEQLVRAFQRFGGWRTMRRELVWSGRLAPVGSWDGLRGLPTSVLRIDPDCDFDADYEAGLRPARRKERRRLLNAGYRVATESGPFLDDFHRIYAARCKEWGSAAVPRHTLEALLDCGPTWLAFVVRDGNGALRGAHLCVDLGDELFAWLGTTERVEGGSLATLLIEHELRWCHTNGRATLNLGTSADLGGVADFKRGISADEDPRWIVRWQRGRGYQ